MKEISCFYFLNLLVNIIYIIGSIKYKHIVVANGLYRDFMLVFRTSLSFKRNYRCQRLYVISPFFCVAFSVVLMIKFN